MRLKSLFFPLILIISIVIFFQQIWPEIEDFRKANEKMKISNDKIAEIENEKAAIENMKQKISSDDANLIYGYLPQIKTDEKVISSLNFLAADSSVALSSLALSDAVGADISTNINAPISTDAQVVAAAPTDAMNANSATASPKMHYTQATVGVVGDYSKIRLFMNQLEKMPMFNAIESVTISPQKDQGLLASIVVKFGYFPAATAISRKQVADFKDTIDQATVDTLNQYISQKAVEPSSLVGANGKSNPFQP